MPKQGKIYTSQAQQLEALSKISGAISSELYLEDILKLIVTVTAEVMNSKICSLMLFDKDKKELQVRATQAISEDYIKKPPIKLGEGIAGRVVQTGKPIIVKDVKKDERYVNQDIAKKEKLCSLLSIPLLIKGKVTGVLNLYTSKIHNFTASEVAVLTTVANQAALAIRNAELMIRSQTAQYELESRKIIERAKDILAKESGLGGEDAFARMRRQSMDMRKSMREISEAIILAKELQK